ncbi:hypothetical protein PG997_010461 [Apiospora hydei]|uniref:AAA+ ATPase domain-containing protein n=1 Tax=Apiospora hydei TaxID=1337664 RepID=A0ABR1W105_9PEZI
MDFLVHPGQTIVWKSDYGPRGCKATSWIIKDVLADSFSNNSGSTDILRKASDKIQFDLDVWYYGYDGRFWKHTKTIPVSFSTSTKQPETKIDSLPVFPLRFADTQLRTQLEKRGETFWRCRRRQFVSHTPQNIDGILLNDERYMVDFSTYRMLHHDSEGFKYTYGDPQGRSYMSDEAMDEDLPPSGHEALFPTTVPGFSMQDLEVDQIQEVRWHKEVFDHLVIGDETKELVQALITNRIESEKNTDWVTNKGNGLIMLLHGGPGTGKTFTAESVAELAEKPLYPITCGDIGTKPEEVEKYLESALHLGRLWDCVVLLDEADVFLEQRTLNDLKRNALVSVFLRVLEYYDGILILTTNRVGIFDEAFKSRIQLALHYDKLEKPQRVQIWKNFFNRLEILGGEEKIDFDILESYVDELAEYPMNGRQIRNTITTARQLAKFKNRPMSFGHLRHVIKVAGKFDQYLLEVHDTLSDDQIARGEGIR